MNRRKFFEAVGGAFAFVAWMPPDAVATSDLPPPPRPLMPWWEVANFYAFMIVSRVNPEHEGHWRGRALDSARRVLNTNPAQTFSHFRWMRHTP